MEIKDIKTTFTDYKKTGLLIAFPNCTFKCCIEQGLPIETCQNCEIARQENVDLTLDEIMSYYNPELHSALVFGGLEPFDSWSDMIRLIIKFRACSDDDIVIYTGYKLTELVDKIQYLEDDNIIVKAGRYIPNQEPHFDEILGVELASNNQCAIKL